MMEELLLLLASLCTASAQHPDLSQKVFTFPLEGETSYVKLGASPSQPITALSLCMRFYSSLDRAQTLFSLAVPSEANGFFLSKPCEGVYRLNVDGTALSSDCLTVKMNGTLFAGRGTRVDNNVGQWEAQRSENPPARHRSDRSSEYHSGSRSRRLRWRLQCKTVVCRRPDVHLWDKEISLCDVSSYMQAHSFTPGNLVNWKNLQYFINGSVYVEDSDSGALSC